MGEGAPALRATAGAGQRLQKALLWKLSAHCTTKWEPWSALGSSLWASHTYGFGKDRSANTSQSPSVGWAAEAQGSRGHYESEKQLVRPGVSPGPGRISPTSCLP